MGLRIIEIGNDTGADLDGTTVHAGIGFASDYMTACCLGDIEFVETQKPISCPACIGCLEAAKEYKKRNGKWY